MGRFLRAVALCLGFLLDNHRCLTCLPARSAHPGIEIFNGFFVMPALSLKLMMQNDMYVCALSVCGRPAACTCVHELLQRVRACMSCCSVRGLWY